ncbi:MAG: hypothetical protein WBC33_06405 [Conexibacter sp.]
MRLKFALIMLVLSIVGVLSVVALSPSAAGAAQRIDMRVLLLGATGTEPSFQAWQAQLRREGVPFTQLVATPGHTPITAATLSQTLADGTQEAKYQAVIVATGGLYTCDTTPCTSALAPDEWAALQTFEQTFHVRQVTAYVYPGADYGLNSPTASGALDGQTSNLTPAGLQAFPYLRGPVTFDTGTYGYQATPADPAFTTLLEGPDGSALVGVFTHPDGREELVQTFDGNQYQSHTALLRHGELGWATRGAYLGDQRSYLELHIDDVFLPDDRWDPATHTTNYDPAAAIRMDAADVATALAWSRSNGLRMDMLFNGGGSISYADEHGSDPLLAPLKAAKASFGWVNHTFEHPNLDCSTRGFIGAQIQDNVRWARNNGFPVNAAELVTGEHSGLANLIPGSPGTIDPPGVERAATPLLGSLPVGTWDYGLTAVNAAGETVASTVTVSTTAVRRSVRLRWDAVCKATGYRVYRRSSPAGAWSRIGTVAQPTTAFNNNGAVNITFTDTGASGSAGAPPSTNTAALAPYGQNPSFIGALNDAGIRALGGDASKPYPQTPTSTTGPQWPAGQSFIDGPARVSPRYPTNVYYNVATQSQLLDEYNWLYLPPSLGGVCVNTAVTTCRTAPATWDELVGLESQRIFGHVLGNDPRPHYFHQSNLADSTVAGGAVFYPVLNATLARYVASFNASSPIVQLTPTQIGEQLARQDTWAPASTSSVTGYIEGARVTIANNGATAIDVPLTGTEVGAPYAGSRSGWVRTARGTSVHTATNAWPDAPGPVPPAAQPPAAQPLEHTEASSTPAAVAAP